MRKKHRMESIDMENLNVHSIQLNRKIQRKKTTTHFLIYIYIEIDRWCF